MLRRKALPTHDAKCKMRHTKGCVGILQMKSAKGICSSCGPWLCWWRCLPGVQHFGFRDTLQLSCGNAFMTYTFAQAYLFPLSGRTLLYINSSPYHRSISPKNGHKKLRNGEAGRGERAWRKAGWSVLQPCTHLSWRGPRGAPRACPGAARRAAACTCGQRPGPKPWPP